MLPLCDIDLLITNSAEYWEHATILVTLSALPSDVKLVKNLKLIHLFSAGADRLTETPIWKETDIPITNSSGIHGPQIAEWVIMQILSNSHKEKLLVEWQKKHMWGTHEAVGTVKDGVGQRLGVLGYGAIGRQSKYLTLCIETSITTIIQRTLLTQTSRPNRKIFRDGRHSLHGITS